MEINIFDSCINHNFKGLYITSNIVQQELHRLDKSIFKVELLGKSEMGEPINLVTTGNGDTKILMWTQMHGDESTATKSIFDLFNIVNSTKFTNVINDILQKCTIYIIPMLNPDGSNLNTRENALGNDLNRDAKTLKNKESQIFMQILDKIKPDFAFNLHDQTAFYNVFGTEVTASISLLAPAADADRTITESRAKAMSVIVSMNNLIQNFIPNAVGRYNDTFCDSCFGDTIQSKGIPTILIECGYFPGDHDREFVRKIHTHMIINALETISKNDFPDYNLYFDIPNNEKRYYSVRLNNVMIDGKLTDAAIRYRNIRKGEEWVKIVDKDEEILMGEALNDKFFYEVLDANKCDISKFC